MSDVVDLGNDRAQEILEEALRKRKAEGPPVDGKCHNCGEKLMQGLRFCDRNCLEDYTRLAQVKLDRMGKYLDD